MRPAKRGMDVCVAALGLVLLAPALAAVALAVRLSDGGPALFGQERVGLRGRRFRIWKFRTMAAGGDGRGSLLTVGGDPRVTRLGAWLRRWKVDELPQLWNVLRGHMSLVGPRPEVPRYVAGYTAEERRVLDLTPGITDVASIAYRCEEELLAQADDPECLYREVVVPAKIAVNLRYAARATVWSDLAVLLRTLLVVARPAGDARSAVHASCPAQGSRMRSRGAAVGRTSRTTHLHGR